MSRPSKTNVAHCGLVGLVVLLVMSPNIVRSYGYGLDYTTHIWLIWYQGVAIRDTLHPTLLLSATNMGGPNEFGIIGVFEPYYAFYGGTLYTIFGALSALLGQKPLTAFFASHVMYMLMAWRGFWLLGRQVGVKPWLAHLPAFVFVTSAYYVTDMYARGSWAELAALSSVPFFLAYGLILLREPWKPTRVLAFVWGTVILTGSHNISLLWSTVLMAILLVVSYVVAAEHRPAAKRIAAVLGLAALSAAVNAWFMLINIAHGTDTQIGNSEFSYDYTADFNKIGNVLSLIRSTPESSGTFGLTIAAPVLGLAFALLYAVVRWRTGAKPSRVARRFWFVSIGAIVVTFSLISLIGATGWEAIGAPFTLIQFPYRLAGYLAVAICLFMVMSLRGDVTFPARAHNLLVVAGTTLVVLTVVQTTIQLYPDTDHPFVVRDRATAFERGIKTAPSAWYDPGSYMDHTLPIIDADPLVRAELPIPSPGDTTVTGVVTLPPAGTPIATNIAAGPWIAKVEGTGFRVAGRTYNGQIVLEREPGAPDQVTVTVRSAIGALQSVGTAITLAALAGLLALLAWLFARERRGRPRLFSGEAVAADAPPRDDEPVTPDEPAADHHATLDKV